MTHECSASLPPALAPALLDGLRALLGSRVSTVGIGPRPARPRRSRAPRAVDCADAVCRPQLHGRQVAAIVKLCVAHDTPIVAYGAGSSLEGALIPVKGGITLDVSRMNQVLSVNAARPRRRRPARRHAQAAQRVHPRHRTVLPDRSRGGRLDRRHGLDARFGHQRGALRHHARERAGAAGHHTRRAADAARPPLAQVLGGLRPGEAVRRFRRHARHHHRDHAAVSTASPRSMVSATCAFDTLEGAVNTVIQTIQSGIPVARIELMRHRDRRHREQLLQARPAAQKHADAASSTAAEASTQGAGRDGAGAGRGEWRWPLRLDQPGRGTHEDVAGSPRRRHWAAKRRQARLPTCSATDVCVPISRLARMHPRNRGRHRKPVACSPRLVGHVGDGNFHSRLP